MNLVKYQDIYLKDIAGLSQEDMDWFNQNLKGKYAYAVNWRWVFTLESLSMEDYINKSKSNNPDYTESGETSEYYELSKFEDFQDEEFTSKANSVEKYSALNKFSSDSEITLEDAKKFIQGSEKHVDASIDAGNRDGDKAADQHRVNRRVKRPAKFVNRQAADIFE